MIECNKNGVKRGSYSNGNRPFVLALGEERRNKLTELINKTEVGIADSKSPLKRDEVLELLGYHMEVIDFVKRHYAQPKSIEGMIKWEGNEIECENEGRKSACFSGDESGLPPLPVDKWKHYLEHMSNVQNRYLNGLNLEDYIVKIKKINL